MSEKEDNAVKLRQYLEIFYSRFVQERCVKTIAIAIGWRLTSNRMVSRAINDKFDSRLLKELNFPRPKDSEIYDAS